MIEPPRSYPHHYQGQRITLTWTAYGSVTARDATGRPLPPDTAWKAAESYSDAHRDKVGEVLDRLGIQLEAA